ncbi:NAD(P)-dependent oxidoreductase [Pseudolabrys sp. FHR47]|uniref:NAD-dependent epimerase/dehydratase family protein n=1 Tax=Pseudolabrys sp. FHR47 TaxID=2562284 RepID=UPI0010BE78E9|nr:NAD-dependent epimerase/dehydratase family protein [Pseudolabrys sp. FHR47]
MRVLLTGATGFVGSHVLDRLVADGHQVACLLRPSSDPWRIAAHLPRITVITGDLAAIEDINALSAFRPEATIHLAWQGVGNRHRDDPRQHDNIAQSLALMQRCAAAGVRTWIALGSQAEYGPCAEPIDESTATRPTNAYGKAKLQAAQDSAAAAAGLGLRFAWLRLFSSYGPKDDAAWLIPFLCLSLLKGQRPALTAGEQLWDFLYITDVARGIVAVMNNSQAQGIFNLGAGQAVPLRHVVEAIRDRIDPALPLGLGDVPYRPDQVMRLKADISRLSEATGWRPLVGLDAGLAETIEWYRTHVDRYS